MFGHYFLKYYFYCPLSFLSSGHLKLSLSSLRLCYFLFTWVPFCIFSFAMPSSPLSPYSSVFFIVDNIVFISRNLIWLLIKSSMPLINLFTIWSTVKTIVLKSLSALLTYESVSGLFYWLILILIMGHIFLLLCMPRKFSDWMPDIVNLLLLCS